MFPKKPPAPVVDYRGLNWRTINTPAYRHVYLLLYWPLFGLIFYLAEWVLRPAAYLPMHCAADDLIPFCELFFIPYLFWFVFLAGIHVYTLLYDVEAFRKLMWFIILTYTAALVIFLLFPTCQNLRPEVFPRDNLLTRAMGWFYQCDTNTNVCPSLHVVGSMAVVFAAGQTPRLSTPGRKGLIWGMGVLISISTVFVKQHSLIDVMVAIPLCAGAWLLCGGAGAPRSIRTKNRRCAPEGYQVK